ncbi:tetratricopeptide repeat protein [Paenisporosarcina sp.]|uniref:tetratricopeptide repeat protein n=1 Tax=Paenisporosarcina sp. TaxID=1932001 RepID=UPI003C795B86
MKIGNIIKFERNGGNITQEELAKDICSVSYLSKIENNSTVPSDEIVKLLFKKLGIPDIVNNNNDLEIEQFLYDTYQKVLEIREDLETNIKITSSEFSLTKYKVLSQLISCRYLIQQKQLDEAANIMNRLEKILNSLGVKEKIIYYKNNGLLKYYKGDFTGAINDYNQCIDNSISEFDLADLYYQLALTHGKLLNNTNCIEYILKALNYYNKEYKFKKSAECQVILGISYQRLEEYDSSIKCYSLAIEIASNINDINLMGTINHNIGYLYALKNDAFRAIDYFEKSLNLRLPLKEGCNNEASLKKILNTIHSLIQLCYKDRKINKLKEYILTGFKLLENFKDTLTFKEYEYHLNIYKKIEENEEKCAEYLETFIIPYFQKTNNKRYVYKYSKMLASIYESNRKYKKGIFYYLLANKTIESLLPKTIIE